jgi:cytoskeletal protein RodZ
MLIALGVIAVLVIVGGVALTIVLATRQSAEDAAPPSSAADFVAPVSSGGFRFRQADESPEEFREHVKAENEAFEARSRREGSG